jgi:hypothetical protein
MHGWLKCISPCIALLLGLTAASERVSPIAQRAKGDEIRTVIAQTHSPIRLGDSGVWVDFTEAEARTQLTSGVLRGWVAKRRLILILKDISADTQPESSFVVYLGLAPSESPAKDDPHYVGRFSFYNEINAGELKATPSVRSFDITSLVLHLLAAHAIADPIGVRILPERRPADNANASIGSITIAAQ